MPNFNNYQDMKPWLDSLKTQKENEIKEMQELADKEDPFIEFNSAIHDAWYKLQPAIQNIFDKSSANISKLLPEEYRILIKNLYSVNFKNHGIVMPFPVRLGDKYLHSYVEDNANKLCAQIKNPIMKSDNCVMVQQYHSHQDTEPFIFSEGQDITSNVKGSVILIKAYEISTVTDCNGKDISPLETLELSKRLKQMKAFW